MAAFKIKMLANQCRTVTDIETQATNTALEKQTFFI